MNWGLDIAALLAVPFLDRGRSMTGWDCWGCVHVVAPLRWGFGVPLFDGHYAATDWTHRHALQLAITRELAAFEEGLPGAAFPILTFMRFGARTHTGLALDDRWMIHADSTGNRGGGTYIERYDTGDWASAEREVRAFRPIGWTP